MWLTGRYSVLIYSMYDLYTIGRYFKYTIEIGVLGMYRQYLVLLQYKFLFPVQLNSICLFNINQV